MFLVWFMSTKIWLLNLIFPHFTDSDNIPFKKPLITYLQYSPKDNFGVFIIIFSLWWKSIIFLSDAVDSWHWCHIYIYIKEDSVVLKALHGLFTIEATTIRSNIRNITHPKSYYSLQTLLIYFLGSGAMHCIRWGQSRKEKKAFPVENLSNSFCITE